MSPPENAHYGQRCKINWEIAWPSLPWATGRRTSSRQSSTTSQALKVYTEKDFPADWAATQNNLANAYNDRIRGDRAENIEQAIEHYELALKV